jgi:hypothetical protein
MSEKPPPKYRVGSYVLVDEIYVIETSLQMKKLDRPLPARVTANKGLTSLGYAYVLDIYFDYGKKPENLAPVCYWEDHILIEIEDPEETMWKTWGDR